MRFPIRYKIMALVMVLVSLSIAVHLALATYMYREDKSTLVFEMNRNLVSTLQSDITHKIRTALFRIDLLAAAQHTRTENLIRSESVRGNEGLVAMALVLPDGRLEFLQLEEPFFESYGLSRNAAQEFLQSEHEARKAFKAHAETEIWAPSQKTLPVIGLSQVVLLEDKLGKRIAQKNAIALMSLERVYKSLKSSGPSRLSLYNSQGELLFGEAGASPLLKDIADTSSEVRVMSYAIDGKEYLGALSKGGMVAILAESEGDQVFSVVRRLVRRSLLFGAVVLSTTLFLILIFSKTLTRPLERLVAGMRRVQEGDLSATVDIQTRDEITSLSTHFNQMIRDLKSSRDQLEEINRDLEKKVADRTRDLEERNQAVKEAQEALLRSTRLASVGEIAGRAAHEVLNPLTGILARLERVRQRLKGRMREELGLLDGIEQAWAKDYSEGGIQKLEESWKAPSPVEGKKNLFEEDLSVMKAVRDGLEQDLQQLEGDATFLLDESHRISRIVGQMRGLTHIKRELRNESIHKVIAESARVMGDLADRYRVAVKTEFNAELDTCKINRDELMQVLTNILRNSFHAIREMNREKGAVILSTHNHGDRLIIRILDNGTGISEENKLRLFTSNFSTKGVEEGTGLGLSISRRFIRAFEGDLKLSRSEVGVGTEFEIELPLSKAETPERYGT